METVSRQSEESKWTVEIDRITPEEWTRELDRFSDATIYQTWAYGEISWGRSQLSHLVLKKNGVTCGMAQARQIIVPILRRGIAYIRWGPLWRRKGEEPDFLIFSRLIDAIRHEYVTCRKLVLRVIPNTFCGDSTQASVSQNFNSGRFELNKRTPYRTFVLDLTPSLEQLRRNLDQKWRNQLNRAEKNNLAVLEGSDQSLYRKFRTVYDEMMSRKAFETTVNVDKFEQIQQSLPETQKMHTLVALRDNKPVSALVASTIGQTGIYLLGATSNYGMQHKGSYLLQWRMIQRLKEIGCRYYDLGGINHTNNPGVYHFKSGFAAIDKTQLGELEATESWLSSAAVRIAENLVFCRATVIKAAAKKSANDRVTASNDTARSSRKILAASPLPESGTPSPLVR